MKCLIELYRQFSGSVPESVTPIAGSGSNRRYYRLSSGGKSVIGVCGTSIPENIAFLAAARHFRSAGLPVPQILSVSEDGSRYLQEDLGDTLLFKCLDDKELVMRTVELLPDFQVLGAGNFDFSVCYPVSGFDRRSIMFDLNYFKYCFLKPSGVEFEEIPLEDDFNRLCDDLLSVPAETFMYRDFQSRNVMVRDGRPWMIDFQGGRKGPLHYDLASFAWQARAQFSALWRDEMISRYVRSLRRYIDVDENRFRKELAMFVLFRTLQVLGAYGFRGLVERKAHFIESIPFAIRNLRELLPVPYRYLDSVLTKLVEAFPETSGQGDGLCVEVCSFSYRKGIPQSRNANGGGFVFDCRGMENPGRYGQFKSLTGLDRPVIEFLEEKGEIADFLDNIYRIVDPHVECFLQRGFSDMSVCFGCTGGQHRSVYGAEHLAAHLKERFGDAVRVHLVHRERGIDRML